MITKHMERSSTLLVIREMKSKPHIPGCLLQLKRKGHQQVVVRMWKNWNPHTLLVGM